MTISSDLHAVNIDPFILEPTKFVRNQISPEYQKYVTEPIYLLSFIGDKRIPEHKYEVSLFCFLFQVIALIKQALEDGGHSRLTIYDYDEEIFFDIDGKNVKISTKGGLKFGKFEYEKMISEISEQMVQLKINFRFRP